MAEGRGLEGAASTQPVLEARDLAVRAGRAWLLRGVHLQIPAASVTALVGPSGVGKSTLLRCFNRLLDLAPGLRVQGELLFHGQPILHPRVDVDQLRARIGMLFQQPAIFPGSIRHNVLFAARQVLDLPRGQRDAWCEQALQRAGLWDEVKDRLREPAVRLSVGQQQRLCLARALAVRPEVLLLDEPTSALDQRSTERIEELILELRQEHAVVLVTHDLAQAQRVADRQACLELHEGVGVLAEVQQLATRRGPEMQPQLPAESEVGMQAEFSNSIGAARQGAERCKAS